MSKPTTDGVPNDPKGFVAAVKELFPRLQLGVLEICAEALGMGENEYCAFRMMDAKMQRWKDDPSDFNRDQVVACARLIVEARKLDRCLAGE
jgi:hypothetical protein